MSNTYENYKKDYAKIFYSVENRKKIAKNMGLDEQEVLDLPKRELHTLWVGFQTGQRKAAEDIKANFFCVPIDIWNHRKGEFEAIVSKCIKEMEEKKNDGSYEVRDSGNNESMLKDTGSSSC